MKMKRYIFLLVLLIGFISPTVFAQTTTNFGYGVTNVSNADPFGKSTMPVRFDYMEFYDDFYDWSDLAGASLPAISAPLDSTHAYSRWLITSYGDASEAISNSTLRITNSETENHGDWFQTREALGTTGTSGKELYFEAKINIVSEATQSDLIVGLMATDTTPISSTEGGIWFQKDDGELGIQFKVGSNTITSGTPIINLALNTEYKLSFHYDGTSKISYFVNDVKYGVVGITTLPTSPLKPIFGIQNGAGTSSSMEIDYIYAAMER